MADVEYENAYEQLRGTYEKATVMDASVTETDGYYSDIELQATLLTDGGGTVEMSSEDYNSFGPEYIYNGVRLTTNAPHVDEIDDATPVEQAAVAEYEGRNLLDELLFDEETLQSLIRTIKRMCEDYGIEIDPHTNDNIRVRAHGDQYRVKWNKEAIKTFNAAMVADAAEEKEIIATARTHHEPSWGGDRIATLDSLTQHGRGTYLYDIRDTNSAVESHCGNRFSEEIVSAAEYVVVECLADIRGHVGWNNYLFADHPDDDAIDMAGFAQEYSRGGRVDGNGGIRSDSLCVANELADVSGLVEPVHPEEIEQGDPIRVHIYVDGERARLESRIGYVVSREDGHINITGLSAVSVFERDGGKWTVRLNMPTETVELTGEWGEWSGVVEIESKEFRFECDVEKAGFNVPLGEVYHD